MSDTVYAGLAGDSTLLRSWFEVAVDKDGEYVRAVLYFDGSRHIGPFMRTRESALQQTLALASVREALGKALVPPIPAWKRLPASSSRIAHAWTATDFVTVAGDDSLQPFVSHRKAPSEVWNSVCGIYVNVSADRLVDSMELPRCDRCEDGIVRHAKATKL